MVSRWCGLWEENKSYLSDGRIKNPKDSCNCGQMNSSQSWSFWLKFCVEFVFEPHVCPWRTITSQDLFLNKCIPLYSFSCLRICLFIIILKRKRKSKQYSRALIRKFQGILVLGKRQRYFGGEGSQLWCSSVTQRQHFWGQHPLSSCVLSMVLPGLQSRWF